MERAFDSGVGEYTVRIDYRDGCGAQATNCTVRVNQRGRQPDVRGNADRGRPRRRHGDRLLRTVGPAPRHGGRRLVSRSGRSK